MRNLLDFLFFTYFLFYSFYSKTVHQNWILITWKFRNFIGILSKFMFYVLSSPLQQCASAKIFEIVWKHKRIIYWIFFRSFNSEIILQNWILLIQNFKNYIGVKLRKDKSQTEGLKFYQNLLFFFVFPSPAVRIS